MDEYEKEPEPENPPKKRRISDPWPLKDMLIAIACIFVVFIAYFGWMYYLGASAMRPPSDFGDDMEMEAL